MKRNYSILSSHLLIWISLTLLNLAFIFECKAQQYSDNEVFYEKYASKNSDTFFNQGYFILPNVDVQFLKKKGILIKRILSDNIGIFFLKDGSAFDFLRKANIKYTRANNQWKMSPLLEKKKKILEQGSHFETFTIIVQDIDSVLIFLKRKNYPVTINQIYKEANALVIECLPTDLFNIILRSDIVSFADIYTDAQPDLLLNSYNQTLNLISAKSYYFPEANGSGITLGVKEKKPDEIDIDLKKRVISSNGFSGNDNHATSIATLAGGAGNSFICGKGVASNCLFYSSSYTNLFPDSISLLKQNNVSIQNHSYGTLIESFYGAEAMSYDLQLNQNKNLIHVFSSGNLGTDSATTGTYAGLIGFANFTGNFKMAKNVISVAAMDTGGRLASFSSCGPAFDGRMVPQIAALGANGTSEAAAIVSGAVAILQQQFKESHGQNYPSGSLIKSILFCTADDIDSPGIDFRSGFGAVNILKAIECLNNNNFDNGRLNQNETWIKTINIPPKAANLKVVLSWTDTAAEVNNFKALSNDLDLEVKEITTGKIYKPWCLNLFPNKDSLMLGAIRKRDSLNTAELISIDLPASGAYEISVRATKIITASKQDFDITFNYDSLASFRFAAPLQQSDFYPGNSVNLQTKIKWLNEAKDIKDTGSLSITTNKGLSWNVLANSIPLSRKYFNYTLPDSDAIIQFRMITGFGTFFSPEILTGKIATVKTNYVCTDSFRFSWNKQPLAQSYKIYGLGDSAYMKLLFQQNDTFIVMKRKQHPENIYAVQPALTNGIPAVRSLAIDILKQGTQCMYSSFYGNPHGDAIELNLDLDFLYGMDSLVFQKTKFNGSFLQRIDKVVPSLQQFHYTVYDAQPEPGANFYRVKIWMKESYFLSEIIDVVYPGKPWIFIYPNPIVSGKTLYYSVRESPNDLTLKIYSPLGQFMNSYFLNTSGYIVTDNFLKGMYYYILTNEKNEKLQTGKIIFE